MDTYLDEFQVLSILRVNCAYLTTWKRNKLLRFETTVDGDIIHKSMLERFMRIHSDELHRAQIATIQAEQNEAVRASQLSFADSLFST